MNDMRKSKIAVIIFVLAGLASCQSDKNISLERQVDEKIREAEALLKENKANRATIDSLIKVIYRRQDTILRNQAILDKKLKQN